jgi:hypothetical protein
VIPKQGEWAYARSPFSGLSGCFAEISNVDEVDFRTRLRPAAGQKHSQAPKQVLGVPPVQAICEERHVVDVEPVSQVVLTGPFPTIPLEASRFLRAFVEKSLAVSWVNISPTDVTFLQSAA